jgi:hypothetical protein
VRIKLDENLPAGLVPLLAALGHEVDTVPAEGIGGEDDGVVWRAAQADGRFLVTQDLDFSDARKYAPGTHTTVCYWFAYRSLVASPCHSPLATLFVHAVRRVSADADGLARARSATEAFLFRRLESLLETRGRFALNTALPIAFDGAGALEVDLLSADARLALELDGAQHRTATSSSASWPTTSAGTLTVDVEVEASPPDRCPGREGRRPAAFKRQRTPSAGARSR